MSSDSFDIRKKIWRQDENTGKKIWFFRICRTLQPSAMQIDLISPFKWNFDLNKSGQKFHHSLKEHHKISNIPKFRCEML
jgi:hypothetical protein